MAIRTQFEVAKIDCLATKGNDQIVRSGNQPCVIDRRWFRALPATATQPGSPPQQALESRQEYPQFERLRKVVVSPRLKTLQYVFRTAPSRQYENGDIILGFAKRGGNGESVHAWEHHVENDRVEILPRADQPLNRRFTVAHNIDRVSFRFEIEAQAVGQMGFI